MHRGEGGRRTPWKDPDRLIVSSQEFPSPFPSPQGERDGVRGFKSLVKGAILQYNEFRIHYYKENGE